MDTNYRLTKSGRRCGHGLAWFAAVLLMACASPAQEPPPEAPPADAGAPAGETDEELVYRVLAGEVQGAEGNLEEAAAEYLAAALASDDPEVAKRATSVALAAQAWQYAAMASDRWVQLDPDSLEARQTAARTLLLAGDYVGAEHQMSGLLTLQADDPLAGWGAVAGLLTLSRHTEKTALILDHLVEEHAAADNPYALFARSQLAARTGDLDQARELADRAAAGAPDRTELLAWAGRLALNQGDAEAAVDYLRRAWEQQPEDRNLALIYANVLRELGRTEESFAVLDALTDTPELRFTRIAFALEAGDEERALRLFGEYDSVSYEDRQAAAFHAARSAELLDRPEDALRWYEQVPAGENGLVAVVRRAFLLAGLGRLDEARTLLEEARASGDPLVRVESLIAESQILLDADEPEEAYSMLGLALDADPDDTRLLYTRSLVAVQLDRLDVAEADLRRVLETDPENAAALNALGYTLADRTDRLEEAERLINAAYELQPEEASIIDSMGWVAFRLGRYAEAESWLREALERDQNAEIAAHLGEVLWAMGREDEAREVWGIGVEIDAENAVLQETMDRFEVAP